MSSSNHFLFVYGTLLEKGNAAGNYLRKNAVAEGPGYFMGMLFDLGRYPGAVAPDPLIQGTAIPGTVYSMENAERVLKVLDRYEGCGHPAKAGDGFIRKEVEITTGIRLITCWIYLYTRPLAGLKRIEKWI